MPVRGASYQLSHPGDQPKRDSGPLTTAHDVSDRSVALFVGRSDAELSDVGAAAFDEKDVTPAAEVVTDAFAAADDTRP
jgi:hypothetical protein